MTDRELMQQALEALIDAARLLGVTQAKQGFGCYTQEDARFEQAMHEAVQKHRTALRERLAQPEQEPVAWRYKIMPPFWTYSEKYPSKEFAGDAWDRWQVTPLYTTPPQRKPLTDEEERKAFENYALRTICNPVELQRKRLSGYGSEELNYLWRGWKARAAHGIKEKNT